MTLLFLPLLPLLGYAAAGILIGTAVCELVDKVIEIYRRITEDVLYEETCEVVEEALGNTDGLIALIQERKKDSVKVGIFEDVGDNQYENYGSIEFKTTEGIDRNLRVGEAYYL